MNWLCKILGHKINMLKGNVYDDRPCVRLSCRETVKGLELPPIPKCKSPKDNVISGGFPQNNIAELYKKLDTTLIDFTNENPTPYASIIGVLEMLKFRLLEEVE